MVLEIWSAISEISNKYYFIIDTINFSVYTKDFRSGIWFFENKKSAKMELEKIRKNNSVGFWLGGD